MEQWLKTRKTGSQTESRNAANSEELNAGAQNPEGSQVEQTGARSNVTVIAANNVMVNVTASVALAPRASPLVNTENESKGMYNKQSETEILLGEFATRFFFGLRETLT